jgi:hypothetical protein
MNFYSELPSYIGVLIRSNISSYINGSLLLFQCKFIEAIEYFTEIQFVYANIAFSVETMRLLLLCHVQLADDLLEIKRLSDDIYSYLTAEEFNENEIWCRTALLLLEVYGDRHVQVDKFSYLKKGFESRIRNHMYQSAFRLLYAKYACKSNLFFNAVIAVKLTDESCDYFRDYNSVLDLYFSLCNNAACRTICGEYETSAQRLKECGKLIEESKNTSFPSVYKIKNNIIINEFLDCEGNLLDYESRKKEKIVAAAEKAIKCFELLRGQQGYEVSRVIEFNLLGMLMLCEKEESDTIIQSFKSEYRLLDAFYKYYYHNACCMKKILNCSHNDALNDLAELENLNVILLSSYNKVFYKRNNIIRKLISDEFHGSAYELNYEFIKQGFRVQDKSASFWGRAFLLSDLQFLSM